MGRRGVLNRRQALGLATLAALAGPAGLAGCAAPSPAALPPAPVPVPDWPALLAATMPAVVGLAGAEAPQAEAGEACEGGLPLVVGSGFRLAGRPWVATAAHVVRGLRGRPLLVWDGRVWPLRLLAADDAADLALLALDAAAAAVLPGLPLAETPPRPGDAVAVLGRPFGTRPTATVGIVSALPGAVLRPAALRHQLQLNAAVNPGNSGGPVVDGAGRVVGVANATVPGGQGLGFAVPAAALAALLARLGP